MTLTTRLIASAITATLISATALAQMSGHSDHDMSQADKPELNHADMQHGKMEQGSMTHDAMMEARAKHMIEVLGTIKKVDRKKRIVNLAHSAIPAVSWPAMTMNFSVGKDVDLKNLKKGQTVQFTLHRAQDGSLPLVEICPTTNTNVIAGLCAADMKHGSDKHKMDHDGMKHDDMKSGEQKHEGMSHDGMKH